MPLRFTEHVGPVSIKQTSRLEQSTAAKNTGIELNQTAVRVRRRSSQSIFNDVFKEYRDRCR